MQMEKLNSYFGAGTVLKGTLKFRGLLRFDGEFEGEIDSEETFIVGKTGKVTANIKAGDLYNFGSITGDIKAINKISLHIDSTLEGNIDTPVLVAEAGAYFQGSCAMPKVARPEPKKKDSAPDEPVAETPEFDNLGNIKESESGINGKVAAVMAIGGLVVFALWFGFSGSGKDVEIQAKEEIAAKISVPTPTPIRPVEPADVKEPEVVQKSEDDLIKEAGEKAFAARKYKEALKNFKKLEKAGKADAVIYRMMAESSVKSRNQRAAIGYYEKLVSLDSNADHLRSLAGLYEKRKRQNDLIKTLKVIVSKDPLDKKSAAKLAKLTKKDEEPKGEIGKMKAEIKKNPSNRELRVELADKLINDKKYIDAADILGQAVKSFSSSKELRIRLARTLHHIGREKDAAEHYLRIGNMDSNHIEALNNKGYNELNRGLLNDSASSFQLALSRNPDNQRSRLGLAMVFSKLEENEKAIAECERILKQNNDYAPAMNRLAWIFAKQGLNLDRAEKLSKQSMNTFVDIPEYIDTLSEIYFKKGDNDEAIKLIKRAVDLVPGDSYYKRQLFKFQRAKRQSG